MPVDIIIGNLKTVWFLIKGVFGILCGFSFDLVYLDAFDGGQRYFVLVCDSFVAGSLVSRGVL